MPMRPQSYLHCLSDSLSHLTSQVVRIGHSLLWQHFHPCVLRDGITDITCLIDCHLSEDSGTVLSLVRRQWHCIVTCQKTVALYCKFLTVTFMGGYKIDAVLYSTGYFTVMDTCLQTYTAGNPPPTHTHTHTHNDIHILTKDRNECCVHRNGDKQVNWRIGICVN